MQREVPSPIVAVLVVFEGRLLLIRRADQGWTFPSHPLRWGEPLAEVAYRAVEEAVGLKIADLTVLDLHEKLLTDRPGDAPRYHYLFLYFTAHPVGGRLRLGEGVLEARWFSPDETLALGLSRYHRRIIRDGVERADWTAETTGEAA